MYRAPMPFGEYRNNLVANLNDTVELRAFLFDQDNIPYQPDQLIAVTFVIQQPDGEQVTEDGTIDEEDGAAVLLWDGAEQLGEHIAVARFELDNGAKKSVRQKFEVVDPFTDAPLSDVDLIAENVWLRLEDCFDSTEGGPWLRDVTLSYFNKAKIPQFINDALMDINMQPPMTSFLLKDFTTVGPGGEDDTDMPILVQGVLLAVIRHLMRAYTEQPTPAGANIPYEDRKDYLQRWQTIYQIELERYTRWLALWKRQFLGLGKTALLISTKAGRLIPAPMRTRYVGRGYY